MTPDLLPPHNLEAEQALLGACMLSAKAVDDVCDLVGVDDFYRPAHRLVFAAVLAVRDSGITPDPIAVAAELGRRGELVKVGGGPYLHTLMEAVPTAANADYYAEQVADAAARCRLLEVAQRAGQRAQESHESSVEVLEAVRADLELVEQRSRAKADASDIGDLAADALIRYGSPKPSGLATPWHDLNGFLNGGLRPGTLTVVGARPGTGKSIAGAQVCLHTALSGGGALLVSLEMPEAEVADRIVSSLARVTYGRILSHTLETSDWERVQVAVDKLSGLPLRIIDEPYLGLAAVRSLARSAARSDAGLAIMVIDYLQLMTPADPKAPRQEQVAAMSRGLKLMAKDLGVPIMALAQLNRGSATRQDKRPTITDLRESGAIEQDADHVVLLHIPEEEARMGEMDMLVAKNRGGPLGTVTVGWAPHFQSIRSLALGSAA